VIIEKTCFEEKHDSRDYFVAKGTRILQNGWKILEEDLTTTKKETRDKEVILPKSLSPGQQVFYVAAKRLKGTTRPPTPMNEARLLTGMETAGSQLEDKDLSQAMKGSGLGTPATRASIIESLEKRKFIRREGKHLRVTEKGFLLISKVEPELKSPQMTGEWESQLEKIRSGEISLLLFMEKIESHLKKLISKIMNMKQTERNSKQTLVSSPTTPLVHSSTDDKHQSQLKLTKHTESLCSEDLESVLKDSFGLNSFRGPQKNVCQKLIQGHNILLVMPTGAGKSLCFQLPGAVRQGTSLIISPLIALMEDHVSKLTQNGFSAECIHSGRNREESREICRLFLKGHLDYLFVSP
jgi:DNA topoisomerase-3